MESVQLVRNSRECFDPNTKAPQIITLYKFSVSCLKFIEESNVSMECALTRVDEN